MAITQPRPSTICSLMACAVFGLGLLPQEAAAQQPVQIVAFGDSLSDPGNAFALSGTASTPPDFNLDPFLVPAAPYARGGHHFQNGATWLEQLARPLGLASSVQPAFQLANPAATNFAVGGARARQIATGVNLSAQVQAYLDRSGGVARPDALYVIAFAGNDVRDALVAYSQGQDGGAIIQAAITSIAQMIVRLHGAGARHFLVWNAADIGRTPALGLAGPAATALATLLSQGYNANLANALGQLSLALPAIRIVPFDTFGLVTDIVDNPSAYGMTNVTSACLRPGDAPFVCHTPNEFLFWDGIHPTVAAHAIIARSIAVSLGW